MADEKLQEQWGHFRELVAHMFLEAAGPHPEDDVAWYPATDVYQTGDDLVIRMELGGLAKDDIGIVIQDEILEVRGIRRDPHPQVRKRFHKMEIPMGPFNRRLRIPADFAAGEATAVYIDGVLEMRFTRRRRRRKTMVQIELS